jgi:hypothetical protein
MYRLVTVSDVYIYSCIRFNIFVLLFIKLNRPMLTKMCFIFFSFVFQREGQTNFNGILVEIGLMDVYK